MYVFNGFNPTLSTIGKNKKTKISISKINLIGSTKGFLHTNSFFFESFEKFVVQFGCNLDNIMYIPCFLSAGSTHMNVLIKGCVFNSEIVNLTYKFKSVYIYDH
jgi:hypothetical protein